MHGRTNGECISILVYAHRDSLIIVAALMSADDITLAADDTTSQGASSSLARSVGSPDGLESDGKDVCFAARNVGDCVEFEEHMSKADSFKTSNSGSWK